MAGRFICACLITACIATAQDRYRIEAFAGKPAPDGVAATSTFLSSPQGLAVDPAGDLYVGVVNSHKLKKIDAGTAIIHTIAGNGVSGYSGDGGPAMLAGFPAPRYPALNSAGDVFVSSWDNCVVRRIDHATNKITTYAGNGTCGFGGDGGPAASAMLNTPRGIAVDAAGNLYIADVSNNRVRRVDAAPPHNISTVAGADPATNPPYGDGGLATSARLRAPRGVAFDSLGDFYIIDTGNCSIRRVNSATNLITTYAGQGGQCASEGVDGPATSAKLTLNTRAIAFDASDNLYLADSASLRIRRVDRATGNISTYVGNGSYGFDMSETPALQAHLGQPEGLAVDKRNGVLYIADWNANAIAKVTPGSPAIFSLYAGSLGPDGPATAAFLNHPWGLAARANDDVLLVDQFTGRIRQVDSSGQISTLAGVGINGFSYSTCASPTDCALNYPQGVAANASTDDYFIADTSNCVIRKVDSLNNITTIAGTGTCGFDSDEVPATTAMLSMPSALALDSASSELYFADTGNSRVRKITLADGIIHAVAGSGNEGYNGDGIPAQSADLFGVNGIALGTNPSDPAIYIADTSNNRVRRVSRSTGLISTVAGTGIGGYNGDGVATASQVYGPFGIWMNAAGDLLIADSGNDLVRSIPAGTTKLITIAGNHALGPGNSGDGGVATSAQFLDLAAVVTDAFGHVYVSDEGAFVVRKLTPQYKLTTAVSPAGGGTITPGAYYDKGMNVQITAVTNPGYAFAGFSGSITGSTNPMNVAMTATRSVVANFTALTPSIQGSITTRANGAGVNERDYTLQLTNVGAGAGTSCQVASVSASPITGTGSLTLLTALPLAYGTLNPGDKAANLLNATVSTSLLRFNLTAKGTCLNGLGKVVAFQTTISIFR